jgi:hypothetical protein
VTHHGKPYALIQPLSEKDLEELEWKGLAKKRLEKAWEGEEDALYDYVNAARSAARWKSPSARGRGEPVRVRQRKRSAARAGRT